jgi:putative hydrolase of the HAD superfamily
VSTLELEGPGRPIRAVLLDAGNTLVCLDFDEIGRCLAREGVPVAVDALRRGEYHGRAAVNAMVEGVETGTDSSRARVYFGAILRAIGIDGDRADSLFEVVQRRNREVGLWRVVPDGTPEALRLLRESGIAVGVISNSDGSAARLLGEVGLAPLLSCVIDSAVVGVEKPDPRIFRMGLERLGVCAHEAVYVGDLYTVDVLGARRAGITGILVDPLWLEEADCPRVRTVAGLPDLLSLRGSGSASGRV